MPDPIWMPISTVPIEWQDLFIEHAISGSFSVRASVSRIGPPTNDLERWTQEAAEIAAGHPDFAGKRYDDWFADRKRTSRFFMADPVSILINETNPSAVRRGPAAPPRDVLRELDFPTCSKVERWGPENMHGQREGYTLTFVEFDAGAAVALGCPILFDQVAKVDAIIESPNKPPRRRVASAEWDAWVAEYRCANPILPSVDRVIYLAAKEKFGRAVTQAMCRKSFGGIRPGPR